MKARVKATNKIVDIYEQTLLTTFGSKDVRLEEVEFLEGDTNFTPDYWTRLEHQAAIGAMQGILAKYGVEPLPDDAAHDAYNYAHALVEMMKAVK